MSPARPDGGFDLEDEPRPPYADPLTSTERKKLRDSGMTEEELAALERAKERERSGNLRT